MLADAFRGLQQIEAREQRQLNSIVEDQRGLKTAVGEKQAAGQLR